MRIAQVSPGYPPDQGGVETVVGSLTDELVAQGHRVLVLSQTPRPNRLQRGLRGDNPSVSRFRRRSRHLRVAPGLWRGISRVGDQVDVFHAHSYHSSVSFATALLAKKPWVFSPYYHGAGHSRAAKVGHLLYGPLTEPFFERAAALICISETEAAAVTGAFPGAEGKIAVVTPGIDPTAIESAAPFDTGPPVILSACRLEEYKQVALLLRAFPAVAPDARLVIVGAGPELPGLRRLAEELGLENRTTIRGRVTEEELRRWQRTASVTVSLSKHEALGLTQLEAAVAGSTMIASQIPAHAEVASMTGQPTLFVPLDIDPSELGAVLTSALQRERPRPSRVGVPTWSDAAKATLKVYEGILA